MNIQYENQRKHILFHPLHDTWDHVSLKILSTIGYGNLRTWSLENLHYSHGPVNHTNFDNCRWDENDIFVIAFTNYQKCILALTSIDKQHPILVDAFKEWYEDGGWEDDGLYDEFSEYIDESEFVDWIKESNITTLEEASQIWTACHIAITNAPTHTSPTPQANTSIVVELLSTDITPNERTQNIESSASPLKKRILNQCPPMLPPSISFRNRKNKAQDILTVQLLGYKNHNYPLLLHFVDSYVRCQMNEWIANGRNQYGKFSVNQFFNKYCINSDFQRYLKTSQNSIDYICSAIQSYGKRMVPCFLFKEPLYTIRDDVLDIAQYFFQMARIARNTAKHLIHNVTTIVPTQIDFLIINGQIEAARAVPRHSSIMDFSDSDDDDHESKEDSDEEDDYAIAKDIGALLKSKQIVCHEHEVVNVSRSMLKCTDAIKCVVENKGSRRTVFVIDRRKNEDRLFLFEPKKYNRFCENDQELVHSALHHNSISSMIPSMKDHDFGVRQALKGQMFVVSFHILKREEIRCYLWREGHCFRFYGEDLINVLPLFFSDERPVKETLLRMYKEFEWRQAFNEFCDTFVDKRFDEFYFGLTGKRPRMTLKQFLSINNCASQM